MRTTLAAALLLSGCAVLPPLRAAEPAQAVAGDVASATEVRGGLRLTARPGDWRGWPADLEGHLTPVAVLIENRTGGPIEIGPEDFTLVTAAGRRLPALPDAEARLGLRRHADGWAAVYYPGAVPGQSTFVPLPEWWGSPSGADWSTPGLRLASSRPAGRARLGDAERHSLLLLFPVPATALQRMTLELTPGAGVGAGKEEATLRLAFTRHPGAAG
jgi:hypothetical protein